MKRNLSKRQREMKEEKCIKPGNHHEKRKSTAADLPLLANHNNKEKF